MSGCSTPPDPQANNANGAVAANEADANRAVEPGMEGAKDNAEELRGLVKLPYEPEDLVWKEFPASGDKGRRVLAVMQLTADDASKLVENASRLRPGTPARLSSENWFPKELVSQNELSAGEGIQATAYAADEFLQPPFNEGTISRVGESEFFVLELFAK